MAQAGSFDEFRDAVRDWDCPGQNMVYADVEGTIGYQCTGLHPVRRKGDGTIPVPGWTSEHEWDGWIPFDELPWSVNPPSGYLVTANNRIHDDYYPHLIGKDFLPPFRARRIVEMLTAERTHSRETFARMQVDTVSIPARDIVRSCERLEPQTGAPEGSARPARGVGRGPRAPTRPRPPSTRSGRHDRPRDAAPEARGRALRSLLRLARGERRSTRLPNILEPDGRVVGENGRPARDGTRRRRSTPRSTSDCAPQDDPAAWRWGALHTVTFAHPLALVPDLAEMFTGGVVELGGDEQTVLQGAFEPGAGYDAGIVPSWRLIVDLADVDASVGVHTTGQSGNPASPHWNDLRPLWATGEFRPSPCLVPAVEAAAEHSTLARPRVTSRRDAEVPTATEADSHGPTSPPPHQEAGRSRARAGTASWSSD